jgi:hydroxymethylpyrimidine/phosphomethylpyrimidine kinase
VEPSVHRIANILSIAGSDPSGGAGVQADIKVFSALGCYGMAAITALTAQNTLGVRDVCLTPQKNLAAQIAAIFADIKVDAVKIGMLGSAASVETVAIQLRLGCAANVVLDPVLIATSGDSLGGDELAAPMRQKLFPLVRLVTPNLFESAVLAGTPVPQSLADMRAVAKKLHELGAAAALIKGGHLSGSESADLLFDGSKFETFSAPRVKTRNTHGTGCALSSAIAAFLGQGFELKQAVGAAKAFLNGALAAADQLEVGQGHGPPHHFYQFWPKS